MNSNEEKYTTTIVNPKNLCLLYKIVGPITKKKHSGKENIVILNCKIMPLFSSNKIDDSLYNNNENDINIYNNLDAIIWKYEEIENKLPQINDVIEIINLNDEIKLSMIKYKINNNIFINLLHIPFNHCKIISSNNFVQV